MDNNIFDFFDMIVCISLKNNIQRQQLVNKVFTNLGIQHKVKFYLATKSENGGMYGCFDSHIKVIDFAYKNNLNNILIFEDDVYPTISYSEKQITNGINFMKKNDWDIFYYGYFPINEQYDNIFLAKYIDNNIIKYNPNAAHAYCLNKKGMEKILKNYKTFIGKIQIDEYFSSSFLNLKSYCIVPMLFTQHLCLPHDNEAFKLSHKIARNLQCTIEKTESLYIISFIIWLYKSIWWLIIICIIVIVIVIIHNLEFIKI